KSRAYNKDKIFDVKLQRGAWYTLHECLKTILKLLAPICPFITETIWLELYSKESIHLQRFPEERVEWRDPIVSLLPKFMEFNNAIWQYKKGHKIALNQELDAVVYAPKELEPFGEDLRAMHGIKTIIFGKPKREDVEKISEDIYVSRRS
ncbi:MAG: class I tRNA ligase family protein, partial [Candidatus Bathyarchaeia archaeon]